MTTPMMTMRMMMMMMMMRMNESVHYDASFTGHACTNGNLLAAAAAAAS